VPRILLVEDDPDVRPLMEHVLLSEGYAVDTAANLAQGRKLLGTERYDLVLVDAGLPDGSGLDLARRAKIDGLRTLIVTGYALRLSKAELDGFDYVMKPVRPRELVGAVAERLRSSGA
jgi:DNA-binding response OmpR family regulator